MFENISLRIFSMNMCTCALTWLFILRLLLRPSGWLINWSINRNVRYLCIRFVSSTKDLSIRRMKLTHSKVAPEWVLHLLPCIITAELILTLVYLRYSKLVSPCPFLRTYPIDTCRIGFSVSCTKNLFTQARTGLVLLTHLTPMLPLYKK